MIIITEKKSVAKDFADALNCSSDKNCFKNIKENIVIAFCRGHLFSLLEPKEYGLKNELPIIPETFLYKKNADTKVLADNVIALLSKHKTDKILIATDADREGEIIARECLQEAHITDFKNVKRFWVSQALTKDVVLEGIKNAKPLAEYTTLAQQGFARQHSDWLCGLNFSRYISGTLADKFSVGRVQTAILSAIQDRCNAIKNFRSETYFEYEANFFQNNEHACNGLYFESDNTKFKLQEKENELKTLIGKKAQLVNKKTTDGKTPPPQLYNLNALQKDAYRLFGYTANDTLNIVQSLYDNLKCVSYPRTPSRVMGESNVELCKTIYEKLCTSISPTLTPDISLSNTRCFDDKKLEAHHALIPLKEIPTTADEKQNNIYLLILHRFLIAFLPPETYKKTECILKVDEYSFTVTGKEIVDAGWKKFQQTSHEKDEDETEQSFKNIDWENLTVHDVQANEKHTKPPAFFNEASMLSFMENPKNTDDENNIKLAGLGTSATRHTFIPKLLQANYIALNKKNFVMTERGEMLLSAIAKSPFAKIADIATTTDWEQKLQNAPRDFENDITNFVRSAFAHYEAKPFIKNIIGVCPICKKEIFESKVNFYCSGYKDGCAFKGIFKKSFGTTFTADEVKVLLAGKTTNAKHCLSKSGKKYKATFQLNPEKQFSLEPIFK